MLLWLEKFVLLIVLTIWFDIINILNIDRNRVPVVMRLVLLELETMMMYSFWMSFFSVVWLPQDKSHDKITFLRDDVDWTFTSQKYISYSNCTFTIILDHSASYCWVIGLYALSLCICAYDTRKPFLLTWGDSTAFIQNCSNIHSDAQSIPISTL